MPDRFVSEAGRPAMPEPAAPSPHVLYLVYWGAAEPLGRSLVLPAIKGLATRGVKPHLLTFEKPTHLRSPDVMQPLKQDLNESGIPWTPDLLTYPLRKCPVWGC